MPERPGVRRHTLNASTKQGYRCWKLLERKNVMKNIDFNCGEWIYQGWTSAGWRRKIIDSLDVTTLRWRENRRHQENFSTGMAWRWSGSLLIFERRDTPPPITHANIRDPVTSRNSPTLLRIPPKTHNKTHNPSKREKVTRKVNIEHGCYSTRQQDETGG
jgi:hypothetical protein